VTRALARFVACMTLLAGLLIALPVIAADTEAAAERRIKAAFLVKFVEYVEWPPGAFTGADAPLVIGVAGDDAMVRELQSMVVDRRFGERRFEARAVVGDDLATHPVQVLFVAHGPYAPSDHGPPMLVVTDVPSGLGPGATLNFVVKDGRVQFEASLEDAERRHLKLGSGLLSVARNLRRGPG